MLLALISTLLGLATTVSDSDADALRSTAPTYLTLETARQHVAAARVAALVTGTDSHLLLSIAWHESRYDITAKTNEPGGKISCGVMTPEPMHPAQARKTCDQPLVTSYLLGAQHLSTWIDATHHLRTALLGVAGGYVGIAFCRDPKNQRDYRCWTPEVFLGRASMIRQAMRRSNLPAV